MESPYQPCPNDDVLSVHAESNDELLNGNVINNVNDVGTEHAANQQCQRQGGQPKETNVGNFRTLNVAIGVLLLVVVLFFTVLSKLTLISMTSRLNAALARDEPSDSDIVSLYWQLLFVMMVPQCITFLRTMMRGVCGKKTATFPWPTFRALLVVSPVNYGARVVITITHLCI